MAPHITLTLASAHRIVLVKPIARRTRHRRPWRWLFLCLLACAFALSANIAWAQTTPVSQADSDANRLVLDPAAGRGWQGAWNTDTLSVAWGDWDGDGDLDLALGNDWDAPSQVYANDGGTLYLAWEEPPREDDRYPYTESVAWGDWDGDGDLDLALGNWGNPSQVYANDGGTLYLAWEEPLDDNSPNAY
ncbi:MAG: VCBS repeat-containing protein, partial [Caldilineaceae bacterium]|nr:VCBS repeat-containing protein [Caldilineaceae bacterium]